MVATRCGLDKRQQYLWKKYHVKSVLGNVEPMIGVTESVPVDVCGRVCDLVFWFMEHDDHDALQGGLDWFHLTSADIIPKNKVLHFAQVCY